jgi:hypothetical protein
MTEVTLNSLVNGFGGLWTDHRPVQSVANAPVQATASTNQTGTIWWGWMDGTGTGK